MKRFPSQTTEFYSKKHNVIFYHITKCAMTTVRSTLECDRVPIKQITRQDQTPKILCVVRDPVDRIISAFLFLRKLKRFHLQYQVRPTSPMFRKKFYELPLQRSFILMIDEIAKNGPFDTHIQRQVDFLGPTNTIQNEFASSRSQDKVTDWVLLTNLDTYFMEHFGKKPQHRNTSSENSTNALKTLVQEKPRIQNLINQVYREDFDLFGNVSAKSSPSLE